MKMKLKSMIRKPITTILLILLLGTISFGFVSKIAEYLVIDHAIEEISKYYRSIGYLTVIDPDDYYVESGAELLSKSDLVEINDARRICGGRLEGMYNSDLRGGLTQYLDKSNTWDVLFWGKLVDKKFLYADPEKNLAEDTYMLRFLVTEHIYGYPEYAVENEYVMVKYCPGEGETSFQEVYENLTLDSEYCVKTFCEGENGYNTGLLLKRAVDDGSWMLTREEDSIIESLVKADEVQEINRHKIEFWTTKDMTALPATQEASRYKYLLDGRWLTAEDQETANPVCVIHRKFAETRNLSVGDTLRISLSDERLDYVYYPVETTIEEIADVDQTMEFTIVGIYDEMVNTQSIGTAIGIFIYIPDSCIPEWYDSRTRNFEPESIEQGGYGFVLKSPELEDEFVMQYKDKLEDMGYELHMIENGWEGFSAAAKPIRQSATYSAVIFSAAQILTLILTAYLYFRQHSREFVISRALGIPSKRAVRWEILPVFLLGITGIGLGSVLGWKYSLIQVQKMLVSLIEEGKGVDTSLSAVVLILLIIGSLLILILAVVSCFMLLSHRSVLEILQGAQYSHHTVKKEVAFAKSKEYKEDCKEENTEKISGQSEETDRKYFAASSEKIHGITKKEHGKLRFTGRHIWRNRGSSVLMISIAVLFLVTLGWISQSIRETEQNIEKLYQGITVEVQVMQKGMAALATPSYIGNSVVDKIMESGFVEESHLTSIQKGASLLNGDGNKKYSRFSFCGITSTEELNLKAAFAISDGEEEAGGKGRITYQEGWDESLFQKDYTETTENYPIIISENMMKYFDAEYGDTLLLRMQTKQISVTIAGSYTGLFTNLDNIYGDPVFVPLSVMKIVSNDTLYYSDALFILKPSKNKELSAFRELTDQIVENDKSSKGAIRFQIWDEELRMAAEPMEQNLHLMEILYPIAQIVAMLAGGMVSLLLLLQSAKRAAILSVLGIPAKTVRKMLGAEQLILGAIGTVLGILLCVILGKWNIELLYSIGLYLFGLLIGTMIGCILVTNKKPLELLQVKE